jgi:hypothetical protein
MVGFVRAASAVADGTERTRRVHMRRYHLHEKVQKAASRSRGPKSLG